MSPIARRPVLLVAVPVALLTVAIANLTLRSSGRAEPTPSDAPAPHAGMSGMDMSGDGIVRIGAAQIREFGITFGSAEDRTLSGEVRTVGIVSIDETRVAQVTPKFSGFIERLYVDFTGQPVRAGQPMAEIYSPELVAAQQELLVARGLDAALGESPVPGVSGGRSTLAETAARRLRLWDVSQSQIDQVLRTGQVRRTVTLLAPAGGVVVEKGVILGQSVQAGQTLYTIADLSHVWIEAELREADAGMVREGASATVELATFPGRPLAGRIEYIYPTLQADARTLQARIAIPNPDGRVKPGMYATIRIATPTGAALTVPSAAVVHTGDRALVFVDLGGGRIGPQEIEVGRVTGEHTEVLAGVEPGQRVVTSAQYILESESNMAEVMKSMIGQMGAADVGGADPHGSMQGMDMPAAAVQGIPAGKER